MKIKYNESRRNELLAAKDFRGFLRSVVKDRGAKAHLSRKAGFGSRSYLTELLAGKKGLSRDSLLRLKSALGLPRPWGQFFERLAWESDPHLMPPEVSAAEVKNLLVRARKDLKSSDSQKSPQQVAAPCLQSPELFQVYAALGRATEGATRGEIAARTGLGPRPIERALARLKAVDSVTQQDERYFAPVNQADHFAADDLPSLSEMLRLVSQDIQRNRERILKDNKNLSLYSAFSVRSEDLPILKKKLRAAVYSVLDEYQDDGGDQVRQLFISLHGQPLGAADDGG